MRATGSAVFLEFTVMLSGMTGSQQPQIEKNGKVSPATPPVTRGRQDRGRGSINSIKENSHVLDFRSGGRPRTCIAQIGDAFCVGKCILYWITGRNVRDRVSCHGVHMALGI
jgi:hypothetical protein